MNEEKHLGKGKEVEVTSNEEGFRGAWYLAVILKSPPKPTSKKRKESGLAKVRYKTLLTEDGSAPLTEMVDPVLIRPLPPQQQDAEMVFEVGETVDARYRDGWWTGILRKVLENSRYRVYFDNPPDVIEFERSDLRLHCKWVDGKWVRPEKQQSTGSIFSSGTAVEVNLDIENLRDVWIPAIVVKENGDNRFLVKYQASRNSDESAIAKVIVDSLHIRPTPPRFVDINYELLEKVDCTHNFGWRAGVITKVLSGRKYNVFFKHRNEDKELTHSELRPHVEWIDGKWVGKSKEIFIASNEPKLLGNAQDGAHDPELAGEVECPNAAKDNTLEKTTRLVNACKDLVEVPVENSSFDQNKKRIKFSFRNGNPVRSHPSKKLTEVSSAEKPSSITSGQLKNISKEITSKEAVSELSTPKTGGAGTRVLKKSLIGDQASPKTKNPFLEKITQTASNDCLFCQHHLSNWKNKRQKVGSLDDQTGNLVKRNVRARRSPNKGQKVLATGKEENTGTAEEIKKNDDKTNAVETALILGLKAQTSACQIPVGESEKLKRDQKIFSDSIRGNSVETTQQTGGGSSQRRKRGRPRKLGVVSSNALEAGDQQDGDEGVTDYASNGDDLPAYKGVELIASQDAFRQKTSEVSANDFKIREAKLAIARDSNSIADDQPLSMWIEGIHSSSIEESRPSLGRTVNGLNEAREGLVDVAEMSLVIDPKDGSLLHEDQSLPFMKKSPIWKTIESMDVFNMVPQKPHFQPLTEMKEEFREGSAIGIMITFADLFEKISKLEIGFPRSTIDSILESLKDLEKHGFDVTLPRGRLNELLSIKDRQAKLLEELKDSEKEITESSNKVTKMGEEIEVIEKKMAELAQQSLMIKSKMEARNLEIANFKSVGDALNERIEDVAHDFEKIASAPWS
ncbi:hypothetical protein SLA2020_326120 [Shorea laevis]